MYIFNLVSKYRTTWMGFVFCDVLLAHYSAWAGIQDGGDNFTFLKAYFH